MVTNIIFVWANLLIFSFHTPLQPLKAYHTAPVTVEYGLPKVSKRHLVSHIPVHLPTEMPRAIGTASPQLLSAVCNMPVNTFHEIYGNTTSPAATSAPQTLYLQVVVGAYSVHRQEHPAQHMVKPAELLRRFHRQHRGYLHKLTEESR